MRYIIYKITNDINGKIYIGKHRCERLDDNYFGSGLSLKRAIKKYGIENFTFHLEIELQNEDELNLLEKYVVNSEFLKRKDVYNLKEGGEGGGFYLLKSREKMSKSHKGIIPWNKGKTGQIPWNKGKTGIFTEEIRKKLSESHKGKYVGENHPMWGRHHTEESLKKMSLASKGNKNRLGKKISEEQKIKLSESQIKFPVVQYTLDWKYVTEYKSTLDAERQTGIYNGNISSCCKNKRKSAGGYIWIYKDDICYFF